jgi:glycosyltransferase involved in cell wall biosynthesis
MRILYDHQVFSLQNAGGASRYHYELMRSLRQTADIRAEVWLGMHDSAYPFPALRGRHARVLSCGRVLDRGKCRYLVNELFSNMLAPLAGTMDVYHPTLYRRMPLVRARRLVVTHHDCAHERFPELFANAARIIAAKRRLYAQADAIICVSESSRQDLLSFYGTREQETRVIYHGLRQLAGSPVAARRLRTLLPRDFLMFVGSRAAYKNFDLLLSAFRETGLYRSTLLLVAGGGPLTEAERSLAKKLEIESQLIVVPEISDELLAEAYARARLLVYPSRCEGFGFPPLEAMAAGCPALVSRTSSLPEICRDAAFYFDPEDPASLGPALSEAVADEPSRERARRRGREVAALYSWDRCAKETLALYRDCQ